METVVNYVRGGSGKEEILLDWNEIAEQYGRFLLVDGGRIVMLYLS